MGDPGPLQGRRDITPLLLQGRGDSEQSAGADRTLAGLDAPAVAWQTIDLALNHRLAQGALGGIVGGLRFHGSPGRSKGHPSHGGSAGTCRPFWPTAFARPDDSPAPPPAATWPRRPDGWARRLAASWASRSFRPCSGANGQTAVAVGPEAVLRIQRWRPAFQQFLRSRPARCPSHAVSA